MERDQILKVMVPVGGFALLLVVVGAVIALNSGGGGTPTSSARPPEGDAIPKETPPPPNTPPEPGRPAGDLTFGLDNPEWKHIGGGLKIWDVKEGDGEVCPTLGEKPNVWPIMHYTGWLTSGTVFDSSRPKGKPLVEYPLSKLVPGWQRGVPGMKVGGIRRLLVPSDLGYGPGGSPPKIPGGATLFFEMELVGFR